MSLRVIIAIIFILLIVVLLLIMLRGQPSSKKSRTVTQDKSKADAHTTNEEDTSVVQSTAVDRTSFASSALPQKNTPIGQADGVIDPSQDAEHAVPSKHTPLAELPEQTAIEGPLLVEAELAEMLAISEQPEALEVVQSKADILQADPAIASKKSAMTHAAGEEHGDQLLTKSTEAVKPEAIEPEATKMAEAVVENLQHTSTQEPKPHAEPASKAEHDAVTLAVPEPKAAEVTAAAPSSTAASNKPAHKSPAIKIQSYEERQAALNSAPTPATDELRQVMRSQPDAYSLQGFDFVKDIDGAKLTLDLAEQYIELGEYDSAKRLLQEIINSSANQAQKATAEQILGQLY
ncbi:FimV/HubP family polar landmark protein [Psychrobacter sp. H7-1]|uniref:FimV/HubP family polar landmark protein n=1 Tax=Psychrobacter sp. H7-1 TaxID=1569265 RepID=UPI001918FBBF|nr:FimV/HubP family polar landmark protein [Psychrobacter sp. H7-1]